MSSLGPPAGGLRLLRFVVAGIGFGVIVLALGMVVLFAFNGDRISQINTERAENVRRTCMDVNERYDRTIAELDRLLAKRLRDDPDAAPRLQESRENTVLLIQALVPRRDCEALVRQQVGTP